MMSYLKPDQRLFGRRKGRPLHKRKSQLIDELLPSLQLMLPENDRSLTVADLGSLFGDEKEALWLEIGFGGGEHLAAEAERYPHIGFVGCEPFLNGVAGLLDHIDRKKLTNIRIFADDARPLLDRLPPNSVARCSILFADPWPKARHAERRFIGPNNLIRLARVLRGGAPLNLATDDQQLQDWMRQHLVACPSFVLTRDTNVPPDDWIPTRYEEKGLKAGRHPHYMEAVKSEAHQVSVQ